MTSEKLVLIAADVVGATQRKLPPEIRTLAASVPVHYEALPAIDVTAEGFPDDILGLFTGDPYGTELSWSRPIRRHRKFYFILITSGTSPTATNAFFE